MRKISAIVLLCLLFTSQISAGNFRLGFKAGINSSTIIADWGELGEEYKKPKGGFVGGLSLGLGSAEKFEFQPEFLFSQKGIRFEDSSYEEYIKFSYFEIPLLFKWNYGTYDAAVRGFFNFGPYTSFLLNAERGSNEFSFDLDDKFKSVDVGLIIGGGIGIKAGPGRILVDLRYSLGMNPLWVDEDEDNSYDPDIWLNASFGMMVGYTFDL